MVSFFRKKASVAEIAMALAQVPDSDASTIIQKMPTDIDLRLMEEEIRSLLTFVVDFATSVALGDRPEKKAVLDMYYFHLRKSLDSTAYEDLYARLDLYTEAVNTPNQNDLSWKVGATFAKLCGYYPDARMTMAGVLLFNNFYQQITEFLNSYQIKG